MFPSPTSGQALADEILRKHSELSPPAQQAVGLSGIPAAAETRLAPQIASQPPALNPVASPPPTATMTSLASPSKVRGLGPLPGSTEGNNAERLQTLQTSPSGIGGIKNPWGRHALQIADAVGSAFFPAIAAGIPGTQLHHNQLLGQSQGAVASDQAAQAAQDTTRLRQAQATEQESLPELHNTQTQLKQSQMETTAALKNADRLSRESIATGHDTTRSDIAGNRDSTQKLIYGYRTDENGNDVAVPLNELSEHEQAMVAHQRAAVELSTASKEYKEAQAKNLPQQMALAAQRVATAQGNLSATFGRLSLSQQQTEARLRGTQGGVKLPGAMIDDNGDTVGTAFQSNVRPTGSERNKGDMAKSAHEQLGTLKEIVAKRPDIFGPANGRKTDFTVWLGSQDPDAQRFKAARTIAADHLAGTFGGRSETVLRDLDAAIGQFKTNPQAVQAGLDQLEKGNQVFLKAGTVRTVGSNAEKPTAPPQQNSQPPTIQTREEYDKLPSGSVYVKMVNGQPQTMRKK